MSNNKSDGEDKASSRYASQSSLGKETDYRQQYSPALLHPIERKAYRESIFSIGAPSENDLSDRSGWSQAKAFEQIAAGVDVWYAYEVSCLLVSGQPISLIAKIQVPADSQYIVESKSLKLYFNSWNNHRITDKETFRATVSADVVKLLGVDVVVEFFDISEQALSFDYKLKSIASNKNEDRARLSPSWRDFVCLDDQAAPCDTYEPDACLLETIRGAGRGYFYSHSLRSNCPITDQPDWATVVIAYDNTRSENPVSFAARDEREDTLSKGEDRRDDDRVKTLCPLSLLRYVVSYREHNGFHEQTIEKIFLDLLRWGCKSLFVAGMYSRRGGIDITPIRTTGDIVVDLPRSNRL